MRVSFGFYGIFIYLFSAYVIIEVLARLSKRFHRTERLNARKGNPKLMFGGSVWFGIILTCLMGIHHASELTVKHYAVQTDKDGGGRDSLRVVLIADLHLGYSVGAERIADMVEKVNAQDADIILVAGDIFDNTVEGIDDPEAGKKANVVRRALREAGCQIVIASFHWGSEYRDDFTGEQRTIGRAAIKAGADIVVGTHPHIVQGIEAYQDSYILYSLGNLVFGGNVDPDDRDAYLARVTFTVYEDHCDAPELTVVPIRLTALDKGTDYRPVVADEADSARIFKRIMKLSSGMGDFANGELTEGL